MTTEREKGKHMTDDALLLLRSKDDNVFGKKETILLSGAQDRLLGRGGGSNHTTGWDDKF